MTSTHDLTPRLRDLKCLLLCGTVAVMLSAPCHAESEWPPADTPQDQIQTVNPEDLQPQTFETPPPAETPAAAEVAPEAPRPADPQPADETPADVPSEPTAPAETPAVPPDATIEAPPENPAEALPEADIPAATETVPEGVPPQFSENPIIEFPEAPPAPAPEP